MFDPEFFPTPSVVIEKMMEPYSLGWRSNGKLTIGAILEPSAGKGDILDYLKERNPHRKFYAIEKNPDLVSVLRGKGYSVIGEDFLDYELDRQVDLIVMNPPFSVGAKHLLHAWKVLEHGEIVCLLNADTVRNPYSQERKLLGNIIEAFGSVEYIGAAFQDAERTTPVEVAIVRLSKVAAEDPLNFDFSYEGSETEANPFLDVSTPDAGSELMRPNRIAAYVRQYNEGVAGFVELLKAKEKIGFFLGGVVDEYKLAGYIKEALEMPNKTRAYEQFRTSLRRGVWEHILQRVGVQKYLTYDLQQKFGKFVELHGDMALSEANISSVLQTILLNTDGIMKQCVVGVFDMFTRYYKENRCHTEGWKTNRSWKVNKKVILPHCVELTWGGDRFKFNYSYCERVVDIDKAMCYISGKALESVVTIQQALETEWKGECSGACESEFFTIRYYQKGTIHLKFKDEQLWERFNLVACENKNWIGDDREWREAS